MRVWLLVRLLVWLLVRLLVWLQVWLLNLLVGLCMAGPLWRLLHLRLWGLLL